jgi:hypothetical protein
VRIGHRSVTHALAIRALATRSRAVDRARSVAASIELRAARVTRALKPRRQARSSGLVDGPSDRAFKRRAAPHAETQVVERFIVL